MRYSGMFLALMILLGLGFKRMDNNETEKSPKNIILMIGDGMGLAQMYAGMTANHGHLYLDRFPIIGLSKTYSASDFITDSGAGATALAAGKKTYDHAIAVGPDSLPVKTILEYAEEHGLSTGLIATSAITHATPACFIAHEVNREMYEEIASDFLKTDIDVFIGGGRDNFNHRKDSLNLIDSLVSKGYRIANDTNELKACGDGKIAGLLADFHLPYMSEGRGNMLPLSTEIALKNLSKNPKGFFIMIEGSQIDWACHDTSANDLVLEMLDFNNAIGKALEFALKDKNTLVIVIADHETGGVSITGGNMDKGIVDINFALGEHTAIPVPVYAIGPGSEKFSGIYENTAVFEKMMQLFHFSNL